MAIHTGTQGYWSSTNVPAATPVNGATVDNTLGCGIVFVGNIINGGTGPTVPCTVNLQISVDGTNWLTRAQFTAGTTSSTTYPFGFAAEPSVLKARLQATANTAQAVTVNADMHQINVF